MGIDSATHTRQMNLSKTIKIKPIVMEKLWKTNKTSALFPNKRTLAVMIKMKVFIYFIIIINNYYCCFCKKKLNRIRLLKKTQHSLFKIVIACTEDTPAVNEHSTLI